MGLPENPTLDDLADEFESLWEEVTETQEQIPDELPEPGEVPEFDHDDLFDDVRTTAKGETIDTLEHLLDDDCESERCNEIRDALGIGPAEVDDAGEDNGETSEGVDDGSDDSGGATGGNDGGGNDGNGGNQPDEETEPDWETGDVNIFGEGV